MNTSTAGPAPGCAAFLLALPWPGIMCTTLVALAPQPAQAQ
ncbi:hypothetical protein [Hymenobacter sp. BRD128]|nr:hypothetical protein [Hymenobacter sp. BRD128]